MNNIPVYAARVCVVAFLLVVTCAIAMSQQQADSTFDASVAHPAYTTTHPTVLFDEAHNNFHTASGRYKPFADLIGNDGYRVTPNKQKFEKATFEGFNILVIANAMGSPLPGPARSNAAFTPAECDAVRDWVRDGGALLLIADHEPAGSAAADLGARFGVDMSKAYTADPTNYERITLDVSWVAFSRHNKNLGDHAITRGRDESERINHVLSFTGQSLKGPKESVAILKLSDAAYDVVNFDDPKQARIVPSSGRVQALAMTFGKGRVVVFGEAAMLTAQNRNFGLNYPGTDNRQLVLNVMHWLSGLLK